MRSSRAATFWLLALAFLLIGVEAEENTESEQNEKQEEGYLGTLDYLLLVCLGAGAVYYFYGQKKEEPKMPSYVIQPTAVPTASSSADKGFVTQMRNSKRRLVVFYGSQTGTAEEFAGRLAKEGARYGLKGIVADPEEAEMEDLALIKGLEDDLSGPTLAVFMMATYGEGDPTDNAQEFYDWLQGGPEDLAGEIAPQILILGTRTVQQCSLQSHMCREQVSFMSSQNHVTSLQSYAYK